MTETITHQTEQLADSRNGDVVIQLKRVHKIYSAEDFKVHALRGISLAVKRGEFLAIMGPSGCGKSTLLNLLGLLDNPTAGEYLFLERDVSKHSERQRAQIRKGNIGFVFQSFNLIDELTVYENVALSPRLRGIKNKTEDIIAAVEYELKNKECQDNYKLKCVLLRILRKRELKGYKSRF